MSIQQTVYEHFDLEKYSSCWQRNNQERMENIDNRNNQMWEEIEAKECDKVRAECKALWLLQKQKIQQNTEPMPCTKPPTKKCWNNQCDYEVSWQWGVNKNWCAGDRCVDVLTGAHAEHYMKMNCIRNELKRHWEKIEEQVGALEAPTTPPLSPIQRVFDSPNSVKDIHESEEEIFPMDLDEYELLSEDSILHDIQELCDVLKD